MKILKRSYLKNVKTVHSPRDGKGYKKIFEELEVRNEDKKEEEKEKVKVIEESSDSSDSDDDK